MNLKTSFFILYTLVYGEVRRFMRIWVQTLVPPMITTALYFMIFGTLIGRRIGTMSGVDYVQFMLPGLVMMSVITNSYVNVSSSFYSAKFQRSIEQLLVAPVSVFTILLGYVLGGMLRGVITAFVVGMVGLFFTDLTIVSPWLTLGMVLIASAMFSIVGIINGMFANNFDQVSLVPNFLLTPLIYLGGVFYSITLLPDHWQIISKLNPILYVVNLFRYTILGISDIPIGTAAIIIFVVTGVFFGVAYLLLLKGVGLRE